MNDSPRICYAGTYERDYPRNRIVIDALREAGVRVEEMHAPVLELWRDKSALRWVGLLMLPIRMLAAYLWLIPQVIGHLRKSDALMIGYVGQGDMLVLGPLARLCRRPVIFNPLVTLTDTIVEDRGRFAVGSLPARIIALIDRLALRLATVVLADTDENAAYMSERFGVPTTRIVVVPVGADESVFFPAASQRTHASQLDVLFVGKFIPLHGVETIIRAAALLEQRGVDARIELVGTGQTYSAARVLAARLSVRNIVWTNWIPFEHLGARLRAADVVLGVFDGGAKAARVVPNKVYQSTACGVATITRRCAAVERYLPDDKDAVLIPPDDPDALAAAIARLQDADARARIAAGGRSAFEAHASLAAISRSLWPVVDLARTRGRAWRDRD
ncbi:MAG: glycosyltransferase [Thermomicrobiales bacterium]|nr:glycosyltransferase [Thermomicrobiales bacterium]